MNISDYKNKGNKIRKHAHKVAFASILDMASKTILLFGKILVVFVLNTIRYFISNGQYLDQPGSIEYQLGNFIGGL